MGPAPASRPLSVSDARVWSVGVDETSLAEVEGGGLSLPFTAAPVLGELSRFDVSFFFLRPTTVEFIADHQI